MVEEKSCAWQKRFQFHRRPKRKPIDQQKWQKTPPKEKIEVHMPTIRDGKSEKGWKTKQGDTFAKVGSLWKDVPKDPLRRSKQAGE